MIDTSSFLLRQRPHTKLQNPLPRQRQMAIRDSNYPDLQTPRAEGARKLSSDLLPPCYETVSFFTSPEPPLVLTS